MPSIALKVCLDTGTIMKTLRFNHDSNIYDICDTIEQRMSGKPKCEDYGLFLQDTRDMNKGVWLEPDKTLNYYLLKDGDTVYYLNKFRNQRLRMLDGTVKTIRVEDGQPVSDLMIFICSKIGIKNHDEYSLCRYEDDLELTEEKTEAVSTLRRHKGPKTLERDAKMEQLRKKLKTDDDEQWLDRTKTLREQGVEVGKTLLLKRRLFYSDRNIDSRDPIQLNLLYNQARDAILDGTHPVTEEQACHFAGIQCQIQFGTHDSEKHVPQLIESHLSDFLPQHYIKVRGIERKILKQHHSLSSQSSDNSGMNEHDAKHMYTRTARSLPTYGVTFFLVKEKLKNKKKLVPRLLGINAESVLRLDENTKEILEIWPLHQLHKWAPTTTTFTLDFGDYSLEPYTCQTNEALRIMDVLNSYISMILKKQQYRTFIGIINNAQEQVCEEVVQNYKMNITEFVTRYEPNKKNTLCSVASNNAQSCKQDEGKEIIEPTMKPSEEKVENKELITQIREKQSTVPKLMNKITSSADYILNCIENKSSINPEDIKEAVNRANKDLRMLLKGLEEKENNHLDENDKLVLKEQLKLLQEATQTLSDCSSEDNMCLEKIQAAAETLHEASVKLYFIVVPSTRRRSQLLMASRNSFIIEENESNKRMSQIFSGNIHDLCANITKIQNQCEKDETCIEFSQGDGSVNIEIVENLPKIHAALFCLLAAHADEKNIDHSAALMSLNTISELTGIVTAFTKLNWPENVRDEFKVSVKTLLDSLKNIYASSETTHSEDIFVGYENFARTSRKVLHWAYPSGNRIQLFENEIIRLTKSVGRSTLNLLKNAHNAVQSLINNKLANAIDDSGIKCAQAGRRLNICSQLCAPCIQDINCQSCMRGAIEGIATSVANFTSTWQPLKKIPEYQALSNTLASDTKEVNKALDELKNFCSNSIDVDSKELKLMLLNMRNENNNALILRNTMNTAKEIISAAESKLVQTENLQILDTKESEEMREQICNSIPILNATMIDLFLILSDPSEADYFSATKLVRTVASLAPEVSKNAYHLLFDVKSAALKLVRPWLILIMDIFNSDDFNLSVKKSEFIQFGETTATILHSICENMKLDNDINNLNSVEDITDKIKNILKQKGAIIQSLDDNNKEHLGEVILKCQDAVDNLVVCAKIAKPTISHNDCQNSIRSSSIILIHRLSELSKVIPEGTMYYDETSSAINMLKEFNSQYKIQGIDAMLSHFKEKCENYKNASKHQTLSKSIKGIDTHLATLKVLSNQKLREKDNPTFINTENLYDNINEIIEGINYESIRFITIAQDSEIQNDDNSVKDSIWKLVEDLQLYMNFNDSFEVRKQLNDDIRLLSDAAINIDVFERKLKENQDDTTQNGLKLALEVGKKNLDEVNNYIKNLNATKSSMGSTILPVTQEFVDNIVSSTDEIMKEKDPKNILKATTILISILEGQVNAQENNVCKKYFENYANQFLTALKDVETNKKPMEKIMKSIKSAATNLSKDFELKTANFTNDASDSTKVSDDSEKYSTENINYNKENSNALTDTVIDASSKIQVVGKKNLDEVNNYMQNLNATKSSMGSTIVHVTQEFVDNIVTSTDQIIKEKDPKNVLKETTTLISILEGQANAQENNICKKYFENYVNKILTALKDVETNKKPMEEVMESIKTAATNLSKDFELQVAKLTNDSTKVSEDTEICSTENTFYHKEIITNASTSNKIQDRDNLQSITGIQFNAAKKWLENPAMENYRGTGQDSVNEFLKYFEKLSWELHGEEKTKFMKTLTESQHLFTSCSNEIDVNKSRKLLHNILQLKEASDNAVVYEVMENILCKDTICTKNKMIMESEINVCNSENKVTLKENMDALLEHLSRKEFLVSTSEKANPNVRNHITQHLQLVKRFDESSLKLLTNVHNATKTLNGSKQAEAIEAAGIQCVQSSRKLNICAEMAGHCINDNQCRIALRKAIEDMILSVDKLKSTCKPLKVLPPTKVLGKELINNTNEVREVLNVLNNFYRYSTDSITKYTEISKKYGNNALIVNLMNAMKIAKDNILTAESQLGEIKMLGTICQDESDIMRKQISNTIATVNAAMADLYLAGSGSIEADYLSATNAVHIMAKLIPELSLNIFHLLNKERDIDNFSIVNGLLKSYLHLFNNFDGFIVHDKLYMQLDKKIAISKCGQITSEILQKVCKDTILEKEIHAINAVEVIVTKTKKLFNDESKVMDLFENKNDNNNIRENISSCVHAAEHLQICTKVTAPTISYSVCQNSLRLILVILQQKITGFVNLVPETSVFYDDASNILKATQEFDFEFKIQAIDNMVHHFKENCVKVKNTNLKLEFTKAIKEIDNSVATLKILSNSKLNVEPSSKINAQSATVDVTEHINDIFKTMNFKINLATSMLFDIAIEENKPTSIKNNIWELTKDLKLYIHCHDSLDERKYVADYIQKLVDGALKIDLAEHNFEENKNDTSKQMELKSAIDEVIIIIKKLKIYINTLYVASSSEPKQIRLYLAEILKRNQHEEIITLSNYVVHRLRNNQENISCPQPYEKFAQNISDAISKVEANKMPISEGVTVLKKIANQLTDEFKLIDGISIDANKSVQNEDNENSFIELQLISASKWLNNPAIVKHKSNGQDAVKKLIDIYTKVSKEMNDEEKSEFIEILNDVHTLFTLCSNKADVGNCRLLLDKILELKVASEKAIVSILVKNFMQEEVICIKIQSLLARQLEGNAEGDDENKNKFALKDNIDLLLAHLSRLKETEYLVSVYGKKYQKRRKYVTQIQVLGPQMLEKAELHLKSTDNKAMKDFELLFHQYKESITRIKEECDQSVDPLMFVRSIGMLIRNNQNIRDDSIRTTDTSNVVLRLIKRVVVVCDSVSSKTKDTELQKSLEDAQVNFNSVLKDGADSEGFDSVKIIRRTEELEAALGGDIVFKNMPENNEPIFMAAHALHACVKEWSARENDIVEAARKAAVLMAKLSNSISQGEKAFSIMTSKNIVNVSNDVTRLARKLAEECTDIRIRNNLLQASGQLPTISGQLKMLASVKTSKLSEQCTNSNADKEAMTMLVDNAQNLMLSIQDVVKVAAAASVKIQSEQGVGKMKWIRARSRIF